MNTLTKKIIPAAAAVALLLGTNNAHAGNGWIAQNLVAPFDQELADNLDQWNADNGNIVDHTIAAGMNNVIPGSGAALEAGWIFQQTINNMGSPVQQAQPHPVNQPRWGNFCQTANGIVGPGPALPLGSGCYDMYKNPGRIIFIP